ncbi:MAG: hypothetical protein KGJ66_00815 [Alphaproteobacteria bacterium]|nr:hypothetical protein [Alphaproteobacteria bacterium]
MKNVKWGLVMLLTGVLFLALVVGVAGLAFDSVADGSEEDRKGSPHRR